MRFGAICDKPCDACSGRPAICAPWSPAKCMPPIVWSGDGTPGLVGAGTKVDASVRIAVPHHASPPPPSVCAAKCKADSLRALSSSSCAWPATMAKLCEMSPPPPRTPRPPRPRRRGFTVVGSPMQLRQMRQSRLQRPLPRPAWSRHTMPPVRPHTGASVTWGQC